MLGIDSIKWDKETLRSLRLRLGWSKSDLARRLKCTTAEIDGWEEGNVLLPANILGELAIIHQQAEACCDEVMFSPAAEAELDKNSLDQINFSRVKADLE